MSTIPPPRAEVRAIGGDHSDPENATPWLLERLDPKPVAVMVVILRENNVEYATFGHATRADVCYLAASLQHGAVCECPQCME